MTLLSKVWLWIVSIILSVVLWLSVQVIQEETDRDIDVSLRVVNLSSNLIVTALNGQPVTEDDLHVTLRVTGPANFLEDLKSVKNLEAVVDCFGKGPGIAKLKVVAPRLASKFGGVKFDKSTISLNLEELVTATKDIEVDTIGDFNLRNYLYDSASVQPESVDFRGPKSKVASVARARVVLNLSDIVKNQVVRRPVEFLDKFGAAVPSIVPLTTSQIDVKPTLVPAPQSKMLLVQPIDSGDREPGYETWGMHVTPAQVAVVGDSEDLARTSTIETVPISLKGLTATTTIRVKLKVPRNLKVQGSDTVTVRVNIRKSAVAPTGAPASRPSGADAQIPLP